MSEDFEAMKREIRLLRFSNFLQAVAVIAFTGAGILVGVSIGWGMVAFALIFLGLVNVGFYLFTRTALIARKNQN